MVTPILPDSEADYIAISVRKSEATGGSKLIDITTTSVGRNGGGLAYRTLFEADHPGLRASIIDYLTDIGVVPR